MQKVSSKSRRPLSSEKINKNRIILGLYIIFNQIRRMFVVTFIIALLIAFEFRIGFYKQPEERISKALNDGLDSDTTIFSLIPLRFLSFRYLTYVEINILIGFCLYKLFYGHIHGIEKVPIYIQITCFVSMIIFIRAFYINQKIKQLTKFIT